MALRIAALPSAIAFLADKQKAERSHAGVLEVLQGWPGRYRVMTAALVAFGRGDLWACNPKFVESQHG